MYPNDQAFLALTYMVHHHLVRQSIICSFLNDPPPSRETVLYIQVFCTYVRQFLAETLGTFLLVVLGDGSVAQVQYIQ